MPLLLTLEILNLAAILDLKSFYPLYLRSYEKFTISMSEVELVWRSGDVMDCHATARDLKPGGNSVKTDLQVLRKGQ